MVKLHINFTNRWLYTLITIIVVLALAVGVYAFGTNDPPTFGHSAGELEGVCLSDGTNCLGGGGAGLWTASGFDIYYGSSSGDIATVGNVGIGTSTPATKLEVRGDISTTGNIGLGTTTPSTVGSGWSPVLEISGTPVLQLTNTASGVSDYRLDVDNSGRFRIYDTTSSAARITIKSDGNVGIGQFDPQSKLDVNGRIKFDCSICLGWGDQNSASPTRSQCFDMNNAGRVNSQFLQLGGDVGSDDRLWLWMQCP